MRNILYIVPSDYESLSSKGVVDLILQRDEAGFFDNVYTLHPFTKNDRIIELKKNNIIFEYGWKFNNNLLNKFKIIKFFGTIMLLFKLAFVFPFLIKKEKISIIRATDPYYMGLIAYYYSKILKVPFVVSIHSDYEKRFLLDGAKGSFVIFGSRKLAKYLEKFVYRKAKIILPIREYMKRDIIDKFDIDNNKIFVFPHGVNFNEFNSSNINIYDKFNIKKEKKIISFVGRFSNENYIYDVIKIAEKLSKIRKDFIFVLAGGGNEYENIHKIVNDKNLFDHILLIGFQPKDLVINLRKQSYLSLCLMGGFSLIEACAAGRPVIAYDIEWHAELVKNDFTGYLVEENNILEIINKINYLLDNEKESDTFGKNAKKISFEKHNLISTILIKQNIYKSVLGES